MSSRFLFYTCFGIYLIVINCLVLFAKSIASFRSFYDRKKVRVVVV